MQMSKLGEMNKNKLYILMYQVLLFLFISVTQTAFSQSWNGMVLIPSGTLKPFFKVADTLVQVAAYYLD